MAIERAVTICTDFEKLKKLLRKGMIPVRRHSYYPIRFQDGTLGQKIGNHYAIGNLRFTTGSVEMARSQLSRETGAQNKQTTAGNEKEGQHERTRKR